MEPKRELHIRVDQEQAQQLGLRSQAVATALNSTITDTPITQVRDDIYSVNVVAREIGDQRLLFASRPDAPESFLQSCLMAVANRPRLTGKLQKDSGSN